MPTHTYSRRLAAIAFAPPAPDGYAYIYRKRAPLSARDQVKKSPYAPYLSFHEIIWRDDDGKRWADYYVSPTERPPFPYANVPTTHQPDPDFEPELVPIPEDEHGYREASAIYRELCRPTGRWFIISPDAHKNLHYYRTRYPEAEIIQRGNTAYAKFPHNRKNPPVLHEGVEYRDPPPLHRSEDHTRDVPENPGTAYVYLRPHVPYTKTPPPYKVLNDVLSQNRYYLQVPVADLYAAAETGPTTEPSDLYRFICQQAHTIFYHPNGPTPDEFPAFLHNYTPLRQIRAGAGAGAEAAEQGG